MLSSTIRKCSMKENISMFRGKTSINSLWFLFDVEKKTQTLIMTCQHFGMTPYYICHEILKTY